MARVRAAGKQDSSFSVEKEAKRLSITHAERRQAPRKGMKVFWFFFSKKNAFLVLLQILP
jgi:hypothetical protein